VYKGARHARRRRTGAFKKLDTIKPSIVWWESRRAAAAIALPTARWS